MFVVIYDNSTKKIMEYRHDLSAPQVRTAKYYFDQFLENNEAISDNYAFAEIPYAKKYASIVIGNHVFNESTQTIEADPSYVPPVDPIPTEPTV